MALASAFPEWRSHSKLDHSAYFPSGLRAVRIACLPSNPAPSSIPESEPRTAGRAGINRRWLAAQTLPHLPRPWPAARRSDFASETFTASVYQHALPGMDREAAGIIAALFLGEQTTDQAAGDSVSDDDADGSSCDP